MWFWKERLKCTRAATLIAGTPQCSADVRMWAIIWKRWFGVWYHHVAVMVTVEEFNHLVNSPGDYKSYPHAMIDYPARVLKSKPYNAITGEVVEEWKSWAKENIVYLVHVQKRIWFRWRTVAKVEVDRHFLELLIECPYWYGHAPRNCYPGEKKESNLTGGTNHG